MVSRDVFLGLHLFDTFVCSACHPGFTIEFVCKFVSELSQNDGLPLTVKTGTSVCDWIVIFVEQFGKRWTVLRCLPFEVGCVFLLVVPQVAQSRKVNNYKDLYGNLDNRLKKIFTRKSSQ